MKYETRSERRLKENFQRRDFFNILCLDGVCHHSPDSVVCAAGLEHDNIEPWGHDENCIHYNDGEWTVLWRDEQGWGAVTYPHKEQAIETYLFYVYGVNLDLSQDDDRVIYESWRDGLIDVDDMKRLVKRIDMLLVDNIVAEIRGTTKVGR